MYIDKNNLDWENHYFWRVKPIFEENNLNNWINTYSFFISNSISNANENFITQI